MSPSLTDDRRRWLRVDAASHAAPVRQIVSPPGASWYVTVGSDKRVRTWDARTGHLSQTLVGSIGPGGDGHVRRAAVIDSDHGAGLATIVQRVDPETSVPVRVLRLHVGVGEVPQWQLLGSLAWDGDLNDAVFTSDGEHLVAAVGNELQLHRLGDLVDAIRAADGGALGTPAAPLATHRLRSGSMFAIGLPRTDGKTRVAVAVWEGHRGAGLPEVVAVDTGTSPGFRRIQSGELPSGFRPDRMAASEFHLAVAPADGGAVRVYDHDLEPIAEVAGAGGGVPGELAFSDDGSLLVVGSKRRSGADVTVHETVEGFPLVGRRRYDISAPAVAIVGGEVVSAGGSKFSLDQWYPRTMRWDGSELRTTSSGSTVHAVAAGANRVALAHPLPPSDSGGPATGDTRDTLPETVAHGFRRLVDLRRREVEAVDGRPTELLGSLPHQLDGHSLRIDVPSASLRYDGWPIQPLQGWDFAESFGFLPTGHVVFGGRSGVVQVFDMERWTGHVLVGHTDMVLALAADDRWLVTAGMDQVVRLWDLRHVTAVDGTGELSELSPELNVYVTDDDEWVMWSPSGYYDSSPGGDGIIGFHLNQGEGRPAEVVAADRFARQLYRPDVITEILRTGSEQRALDRLGLDEVDVAGLQLPPRLRLIGEPERWVSGYTETLEFDVEEGSSPTTRVWLLQDGAPVWESTATADGGTTTRHRIDGLRLVPGPNRFKILARNDGAKSTAVDVVIEAPHVAPEPFMDSAEPRMGSGDPFAEPMMDVDDPSTIDVPEPRRLPAPTSFTSSLRVEIPPDRGGSIDIRASRHGVEHHSVVHRPQGVTVQVTLPVVGGSNRLDVDAHDGDWFEQFSANSLVDVREGALPPPGGPSKHTDGPAPSSSSTAPDGTVPSGEFTPPEPTDRHLFIVSVGVSRHAQPNDSLKDLRFAHADARSVASRFAGAEGRLFGQVWQRVLADEHATRDGVRTALSELRDAVADRASWKREHNKHARDLTIFFFSGHGATYTPSSTEHELYLVTHDVDPDDISGTALTVPEVGETLAALPTDTVVLVDACRAGRAGRDLMRRLDERELGKRLHEIAETNQAVFASARYHQISREYELRRGGTLRGHGLFTHALLDELAASGGRDIAIGELTTAVQRTMDRWTGAWPTHKQQQPSYRTYGDFPLVNIYS